ncbi:MAG TPA: Rieske (2Fe-2S) protein [Sphingomonas sp.]|jgi:nitrite reductase/ring-hydroxylating ferredoxin subunit
MGPELNLAGVYRRRVGASLRRIWENVYDWEHLAHLHEGSFSRCDLLDRGAWGWRARLRIANGDEQVIEVRTDQESGRYVSTTLEGTGAGTEIRVVLSAVEPHITDVVVEFHVPEPRQERLDAIGRAYVAAYARLWDEDEAMMLERERMLGARTPALGPADSVDLGAEADVRARLPVLFEFGGRPFRLVDLEGALVAHSTICPHWLGPLGDAPVGDGAVRCPWHGYVFDIATGRCATKPGLALEGAPSIAVERGRVMATTSTASSVTDLD